MRCNKNKLACLVIKATAGWTGRTRGLSSAYPLRRKGSVGTSALEFASYVSGAFTETYKLRCLTALDIVKGWEWEWVDLGYLSYGNQTHLGNCLRL